MHVDFFVKESLRKARKYGTEPRNVEEGKQLPELFYAEQLCGILYNLLDKNTVTYLLQMVNEVMEKEAVERAL